MYKFTADCVAISPLSKILVIKAEPEFWECYRDNVADITFDKNLGAGIYSGTIEFWWGITDPYEMHYEIGYKLTKAKKIL